jgi:hypothetical protein
MIRAGWSGAQVRKEEIISGWKMISCQHKEGVEFRKLTHADTSIIS